MNKSIRIGKKKAEVPARPTTDGRMAILLADEIRHEQPAPEEKDSVNKEKDSVNIMARGKNKYIVGVGGKDVTVYADKAGHVGNGISFWVKGDVLNDLVAHFPNCSYFTLAGEAADTRPDPVPGVEYYTLEDIRRALKDLNYYSTDQIVDKVRQRISVRDDGRYTVEELQVAFRQTQSSSGNYYAELVKQAALQARKNRVFDAHTR